MLLIEPLTLPGKCSPYHSYVTNGTITVVMLPQRFYSDILQLCQAHQQNWEMQRTAFPYQMSIIADIPYTMDNNGYNSCVLLAGFYQRKVVIPRALMLTKPSALSQCLQGQMG